MWAWCSEQEGVEREAQGDLHPLECTNATARLSPSQRVVDASRAVHRFYRSDGENLHTRYPPRTLLQLEGTVEYLQSLWALEFDGGGGGGVADFGSEAASASVYVFVMDRLAGVRQELVTHGMGVASPDEAVSVLGAAVRLYLHAYGACAARVASSAMAAAAAAASAEARRHLPTSSLPPGPWYDDHLHESALGSCLTTALSFAAAGPRQLELQGELRACALLLQATMALKSNLTPNAAAAPVVLLRLPQLPRSAASAAATGLEERAWALLAALRGGNVVRAARLLPPPETLLGLLGLRLLPLLRLWRLLLADKAAGKDEQVSGDAASRLLLLPSAALEAEAVAFCWARVCGAPFSPAPAPAPAAAAAAPLPQPPAGSTSASWEDDSALLPPLPALAPSRPVWGLVLNSRRPSAAPVAAAGAAGAAGAASSLLASLHALPPAVCTK